MNKWKFQTFYQVQKQRVEDQQGINYNTASDMYTQDRD